MINRGALLSSLLSTYEMGKEEWKSGKAPSLKSLPPLLEKERGFLSEEALYQK